MKGILTIVVFSFLPIWDCLSADYLTGIFWKGDAVISIDKSLIKFSAGDWGRQYEIIEIFGPKKIGVITLSTPDSAFLRTVEAITIKDACDRGILPDESGFNKLSVDSKLLKIYLGGAELDQSEGDVWIYFSTTFCSSDHKIDNQANKYMFYLCSGDDDDFICSRIRYHPSYSAQYFISSKNIKDWKEIDAEVKAYLEKVVKSLE